MSLYQRKDSPFWWVKISIPGRKPVSKSAGTVDRKQAQEFHDRLAVQLWEQSRLGIKPEYSWKEAAVRWIEESQHKASHSTDLVFLRWLDPYLGDKMLSEIDRAMIDKLIAARRAGGGSNATVNRTLQLVRVILRRAVNEWDWLDKTPKFRVLPEPKRRVRFLTREQATRLLAELPEHLADMARFSLETGLRRANVTGLLWSQVDLIRRHIQIHADQAKGRQPIPVPLTQAAVEVLRKQLGKHHTHVFSYRGEFVTQVNTKAWRHALVRAGIDNFRWHDLRHTWASWHAQAGTPLHVLQELGGWESPEMVQKYAHLASEHLAAYVDRASLGPDSGTGFVATLQLRGQK